MILVAILTVRADEAEAFRAFEHGAAQIMARHGGAIERAVVIPAGEDETSFREIHIVRFPDVTALAAYRSDRALERLQPLRARSVIATEIMTGEDGPEYGTGSG
jgi:hypothetical protein